MFGWVLQGIGLLLAINHASAMPRECTGNHRFSPVFVSPWEPTNIRSPDFPKPANASGLDCTWKIKPQHGFVLEMTVLEVHMGDTCYSNKLTVHDATPANGATTYLKTPGITAACNQIDFPPATRSLVANGEVTVRFQMLKNDDNVKFNIKFAAKAKKDYCEVNTDADFCPLGPCGGGDCVFKLGSQTMKINADTWEGLTKGARTDCKATYEAPEDSQVAINFLEMDVQSEQPCSDFVELTEEEDTPNGVIGTKGRVFCGQHLPNYPAPSILASGSNKLTVRYKTDTSNAVRGKAFKATVHALNPAYGCNGDSLDYAHSFGTEECAQTCSVDPVPPLNRTKCEKKPMPFTITVLDIDTNKPISNAEVNITSVDLLHTTVKQFLTTGDYGSEEDGECHTTIYENANYTLNVDHPKYFAEDKNVEMPWCKKSDCSCDLETVVKLQFIDIVPPCNEDMDKDNDLKFSVKITDRNTDRPVAGASVDVVVELAERECQLHRADKNDTEASCRVDLVQGLISGADGAINHPLEANGVYIVTAGKTNYTVESGNFSVSCTHDQDCGACTGHIDMEIEELTCNETVFRVVVRDKETQKPIENAEVVVRDGDKILTDNGTKTDADGEIVINGMPKGEFAITVSAEHYVAHETSKVVDCDVYHCEACLPVVAVDLTHKVYPCPGVPLNITIVDERTKERLEGAHVTIKLTTENGTEVLANKIPTPSNGFMSLAVENNRSFEITVTKDYYDTARVDDAELCCDMSDLTCMECALDLTIPMRLIECEYSSLVVTVNDSYTGNPIVDAKVTVKLNTLPVKESSYYLAPGKNITSVIGTEYTATTDENGVAGTDAKAMAEYTITVEHPDYEPFTVENVTIKCDVNSCGTCTHLTQVKIRKTPPECLDKSKFLITVEYTNKAGEEVPLPGAKVTLELLDSTDSHPGAGLTDANGLVTPLIHYDGKYEIKAEKMGFLDSSAERMVVEVFKKIKTDEYRQNQICPNASVPLVLKVEPHEGCPYNYTITVLDVVADNQPLVGATVDIAFTETNDGVKSVTPYNGRTTDNEGKVVLPMNANGDYSIVVTKDGYNRAEVLKDPVNCPRPEHWDEGGWHDCEACTPMKEVPVTMPHCDIDMPVEVRSKRTNEVIADAKVTVTLTYSDGKEEKIEYPIGTTDDQGLATFTIPAIGNYSIYVTAPPSYLPKEITNKQVVCDPRECGECGAKVKVELEDDWCENVVMLVIARNTEDNKPLEGADLTVTLENIRADGGRQIYTGKVPTNGKTDITLPSKGTYVIQVSKEGFVTQVVKHVVNFEKGDCESEAEVQNNKIVVPVPPEGDCPNGVGKGGVTVSLTWLETPQDLDLYSWKVGRRARPEDRCLAYFCDRKDECNCVNFRVDNENGGLEGAESINYCCKDDATHMLYVDDIKNKFNGTANGWKDAKAKITIMNGTVTKTYALDVAKAGDKRYWIAGCLRFVDGDFQFLESQNFMDLKPESADPLYCHSKWDIWEPEVLGNQSIIVHVRDALTNKGVDSADLVTVFGAKQETSILSQTDSAGIGTVQVTKFGGYMIAAGKEGYSKTLRYLYMSSKHLTVQTAMSITSGLSAGSLRLILNWNASPKDMDLHVLQVNSKNGLSTCEVYWAKRDNCEESGLYFNIDNKNGGLNGGETATLTDMASHSSYTYMVFVDDYGGGGSTLQGSGSQLTISDSSNTTKEYIMPRMDNYAAGVRYWLVGCMKIVGESYEFVTAEIGKAYSHDSPAATKAKYCHNLFVRPEPPKPTTPKPLCKSTYIVAKVQDSFTREPMSRAYVTFLMAMAEVDNRLGSRTQFGIQEIGKVKKRPNGIYPQPIYMNGNYAIYARASNYIDIQVPVPVNYDTTNCATKATHVLVSMTKKPNKGDLLVMLNWLEKPADLDLIIKEVTTAYGDGIQGCIASPRQKCPTIETNAAINTGGLDGAEIMTLKGDDETRAKYPDMAYLVYVDATTSDRTEFRDSEARITFTDGWETTVVKMVVNQYANERYWVVGAIQFDGANYKFADFTDTDHTTASIFLGDGKYPGIEITNKKVREAFEKE